VRLQLLSSHDRTVWPTERRSLIQRYADAPAAELLVPTLPALVASKTATWVDRHAARDLWDLWAMNRMGAIDAVAEVLYRRYGYARSRQRAQRAQPRRSRTGMNTVWFPDGPQPPCDVS